MAHRDDEWAAGLFESPVALFDQLAADPRALVFRQNRHRPERSARYLPHASRAIHDVTRDSTMHGRDQGEQRRPVYSRDVNDVAFLILPERTTRCS